MQHTIFFFKWVIIFAVQVKNWIISGITTRLIKNTEGKILRHCANYHASWYALA